MDRTKVSGTFDVGSIPAGASDEMVCNARRVVDFVVFLGLTRFFEPSKLKKGVDPYMYSIDTKKARSVFAEGLFE